MCLMVLLPLVTPYCLQAHARPACPKHPQNLAAMQGCYRPLLVFAPTANDARLVAQLKVLDAAADSMVDRDVLLVPLIESCTSLQRSLDAPSAALSADEAAAARKRLDVAPGSFSVVLLGKDGGIKLHSAAPITIDRLNSLIDTMPMRRLEMQRPHAH